MATPDGLDEELALALAAVEADPANAYGLAVVAERLRLAGREEEAAVAVRRAAALNPGDDRVLRKSQTLLLMVGDFAAAVEQGRLLVGRDPADTEARFQLIFGLLALRAHREALDHLDIYLRYAPESALGWRNHAGALESLGEFHRALASSNRAVLLEASNPEFRLHRAGLLNHLGRTADALAEVRAAEVIEGETARVAWFGSVIHDGAGDLDAAITHACRARDLAPDNLDFARYVADLEKRRAARMSPPLAAGSAELPGPVSPRPGWEARTPVRPGWRAAVASQGRILVALLLRDAQTRFGETRLGYLWALLEPISHLALIASVFAATHIGGTAPVGSNLIVYYFTGVLPYLLFSNTVFGVQQSLIANRPLLQIPLVQHVDVLLARGLLELLTQFCVAVIVLTAFVLLGLPAVPDDLFDAASGLFAIWVVGFGIGVINATIIHFVKSWDHVFANVVRALYFTSGIFLNPAEMPEWVRDILVWNPVLQAIDWIRSGFFDSWHPVWLDRGYVVLWGLAAVLIGFSLERACRRRLSVA